MGKKAWNRAKQAAFLTCFFFSASRRSNPKAQGNFYHALRHFLYIIVTRDHQVLHHHIDLSGLQNPQDSQGPHGLAPGTMEPLKGAYPSDPREEKPHSFQVFSVQKQAKLFWDDRCTSRKHDAIGGKSCGFGALLPPKSWCMGSTYQGIQLSPPSSVK